MMLMICDTLYKTSPRGQFYKKKILPLCVFFLPRYNHSLKRRHFYTIADVLEYIKEKKKKRREDEKHSQMCYVQKWEYQDMSPKTSGE